MDEGLLRDIARATRPVDRGALATVVRAAGSALAGHIGASSRSALSTVLGESPIAARPGELFEPAQLYDAVAAATSWRRPAAIALAQAVLVEIARRLGPRGRRRLGEELPPAWARLLIVPEELASAGRGAAPRTLLRATG